VADDRARRLGTAALDDALELLPVLADWIASTLAPMRGQSYFSRIPRSCRAMAQLSAVWPPRVARTASGRSLAMIFSTISGVIGST